MSPSGVIPRAIVAAVIIATMPVAAVAQQTLKIFDAHLRYNQAFKAGGWSNKMLKPFKNCPAAT
jgi:hypothetical protein